VARAAPADQCRSVRREARPRSSARG
jgi:hypothetical protein